MSAANALQKAVFETLAADAPLIALLGGQKIYDGAPRNAEAPYLHLGEFSARDWSTATEAGWRFHSRWSPGRGRRDAPRELPSPSACARCCTTRRSISTGSGW